MTKDGDDAADSEPGRLDLADLAQRTGEEPPRLAMFSSLGLIPAGDVFDLADVERVRLIQLLERRGNDIQTIARCQADQPDGATSIPSAEWSSTPTK